MLRRSLVMALIWLAGVGPLAAQHAIEVQRHTAKGDYFEAWLAYERMPKRTTTTAAVIAAARAAWGLGLPEQASNEFEQALRDPDLSEIERARLLLSRGIIEYQEGRYQVAILYGERALQFLPLAGPLRAKVWLLWGESLMQLGSYGAAELKYQKGLAEADTVERGEIHYLLGRCQLRLGRYQAARENLELVPVQHERTAATLRQLAEIALLEGKHEHAAFWLTKGRQEYPDDFLDSWVDYALLQAAVQRSDVAGVRRIQDEAEKKYPPADQWLTLLHAAAENFFWTSAKEAGNADS